MRVKDFNTNFFWFESTPKKVLFESIQKLETVKKLSQTSRTIWAIFFSFGQNPIKFFFRCTMRANFPSYFLLFVSIKQTYRHSCTQCGLKRLSWNKATLLNVWKLIWKLIKVVCQLTVSWQNKLLKIAIFPATELENNKSVKLKIRKWPFSYNKSLKWTRMNFDG